MTLWALQLGAQERFEFKEMHMGMEVRIVLYAPDVRQARVAARAAFDGIADLENIMSDYRPQSELRRLERRTGEWVTISGPLLGILAMAKDVAGATKGAFDPTVGPLVTLWRDARLTRRLPSKSALDSARALVGWNRIELDMPASRVRLAPATRIDLGGIAKGFIIHFAALTLQQREVIGMVEAGGDIAVSGRPPGRRGWIIALGDTVIVLDSGSVSTSGPGAQFVEIDGVRYSHVVDPRTGSALTNGHTVTVTYHVGAIADALATALSVLGPERAQDILARYPGVTASFRRER
jgi:thiamine biosynthesis lipoprotein